MSHIIRNAYKKITDHNLQKAYEHAVDEMVKRGHLQNSVKKIGGKIIFEVDENEKTGWVVDKIEAGTRDELVDKYIDAEIDQPRYKYDEDFDEGLNQELIADGYQKIDPGKHVDIPAIREWVMTTKIHRDPELQEALKYDHLKISDNLNPYWESSLDRAVDSIAFKVARKIYYVGKKPPTMTPEEWDDYIKDKRPEPGTYSKNEDWGPRGFPYGPDYKYREGRKDMPNEELIKSAAFKGWKEGGWDSKLGIGGLR
jgi:hypothetical protein|tara:strand:- start:444 stop:1208 length:765 start_codon:yes stop_codon:yes gene_type:complete